MKAAELKMAAHRVSLWQLFCSACVTLLCVTAYAQGPTPGQNINMVSGTTFPDGDPFLQRQNEPSIAVSTRNPLHLLAGANDYRTVDLNFFATGETGDAWLGIFKSFDAGASWRSTLLPGYPLDQTPEGKFSLLKPFNAASDPVVRAGPNGFFGYSGIAFNRGTNNGVVFFARFVDLNNKENGNVATGAVRSNTDPIRYVGTSLIAQGNATKFLDKPWMAIDVSRHGASCTLPVPQPDAPGGSVTQSLAVGNIYVAFTAFNYNQVGTLLSSQILFSRSVDCGATWSKPVNLTARDDLFDTDQDSINQGPTIAIDPETGFVYVAWRRFRTGEHSDAIVATASFNGGQSFLPGIPVITLPPFSSKNPTGPSFFDQGTNYQGTTGTSMRIDAFPTLAVGDSGSPWIPGRIYLAWSQRGVGPNGDARIMMITSPDGLTWPVPFPIDNGPLTDLGSEVTGNLATPLTRGHQFMPQMTFTGGKLMVLYYDLRQDHTLGLFTPDLPFAPDSTGRFYQEARDPRGELPGSLGAVFTPFLDDAGLTKRRHTVDVVVAQFDPKSGPPSAQNFTTARVSNYKFGLRNDGSDVSGQLQQLQVDPPNFPLFKGGTTPFFGDYVDIAGLTMVPQANGSWRFNTGSVSANTGRPIAPVFHATWTDNRDIRPPKDGNWQNYTPVGGGVPSIFGQGNTPSCQTGNEGMRNQNIYTSRITAGLVVSSPQNSKPLSASLQRAFVVLVQNQTNFDKSFRLTIPNQPPGSPANGFASFTAGTNNPGPVPPAGPPTPPSPVVTTLDIKVPAHSGVAPSVFAVSTSPTASITVNVDEINAPGGTLVSGGLSSFVVLNADATTPTLVNPDGAPGGTDIASVEVYSPNFSNPNYSNPNYSNPNYSNPNFSNPNYSNPNYSNPNFSNADIATSTVPSPNYSNGDLPNPNYSNPNYSNPNFSNTDLTNTSVADASYTLTNQGDTSAGYNVNLVLAGTLPSNAQFQLLINKTYLTPVAQNCALMEEQTTTVGSVVNNPNFSNPNFSNPNFSNAALSDGSLALKPGESATITLRGFNVTCSRGPRCQGPISGVANIEDIATQAVPLVTAQAANTNDPTNSHPTVAPLFIVTASLPNGITGQDYNQPLSAIGGTLGSGPCSAYFWNWSGAPGSGIPPGLTLSTGGVIMGNPTAPGTYNVRIQVSTCREEVATRVLSIQVVAPLIITTTSVPPGVQGVSYNTTLSSTGGIPPVTWNVTGLPAGLNFGSNGTINGTTATSGTFPLQVQATDSSPSPQTSNAPLGLTVFASTGNIAFVQPIQTTSGQPISPAVTVRVIDNTGAVVPGVPVTIAIGNNPSGGVLSGTTTVLSDATGIATFSNLLIDKPGAGYTLIASAMGAGGTSSSSFNIVVPTCAAFPTGGSIPFTTIYSVARDSAGDAFVVGGRPNGGILATLQSIPLPSLANQQFCNPALLETNYVVPAYVPTAAERGGDFSGYAGLVLIDPATGSQFSNNMIPSGRLDTVFAWRIPPHSSTLLQYACSIEPTLKSLEGNVPTSVKFQNQTTGTGSVTVYWINYAGQRVFYNTLGPGQSYVQGTFLTHPWVVTDGTNNANSCLGIWLPTESPDTAVITGSTVSPAPPTNLTAMPSPSAPSAAVALAWSASTSAVVGYNVYRAAVQGGPFTKLNSVPVNATTFTDSNGITPGKTYFYVVTSVDSGNVESAYSNEVSLSII
jgi:uncharacterized protein YjbI with pentapeptide repeats